MQPTSLTPCEPKAGSPAPTAGTLRLEIKGTIPSFKNNKLIFLPNRKRLEEALARGDLAGARQAFSQMKKCRPIQITKPEYQEVMAAMVRSIVSQLLSAFQISEGQIQAESSIRSLIASSLPADDCWEKIPDIQIRAELCPPGDEGATVEITRL